MECKSFWGWERKQIFLFHFNRELRAILHLPYLKQEEKAFLVIARTFRFPEKPYEKKSCYLFVRLIHDGLVVEARQKNWNHVTETISLMGEAPPKPTRFFLIFLSFL